ncbi:MAG TPA: hypothetical protein PKZ56_00650 [Candidatus Paceibacterota bacterium]|nr:hypothetical protein [Candidatus Paceibacterota bacterium]
MKTLKTIVYGMAILFAISFVGSICYILFSNSPGTNTIITELAGKILHLIKILFYLFLILLVLGVVGGTIYYLSTRPATGNAGANTQPNGWQEFRTKAYEFITSFFINIGKVIKWMAKEAKILFILIVLGISLWMILEFSPGLAKKWAGAKPPKGVEWSTKQYLQANGWWPDGKKTIWFWQDSKPKVAKKEPLTMWDYFDNVNERSYMLKKQAIDSGLYDKPSASKITTTDQNTSSGSGSGTSINQSGQTVNIDAIVSKHPLTKAIQSGSTVSTDPGTTNWNQGQGVTISQQIDVDAVMKNHPLYNDLKN